MSESPNTIAATRENFQEVVIEASRQQPVLVDFWAEWCQPCHMLAPVLDRLADEYAGRATVAKVDTDQYSDLAQRYGVRGLPTVKLFRDGQVVDEQVGVQPDSQIRAMLDQHLPRASDPLREQAQRAMADGDTARAAELLSEALEIDPENTALQIELAELLCTTGDLERAEALLNALPLDLQVEQPASRVRARCEFARNAQQAAGAEELERRIGADPRDLQARYELGARRIQEGHYTAAMDQFLEIMKRDRGFGDDAGRKALLATFEILGEDETVDHYRRKMAAALY